MLSALHCKFCQGELRSEMIIHDLVICGHCHRPYKLEPKTDLRRAGLLLFAALTLIGAVGFAYMRSTNPETRFLALSLGEAEIQLGKCARSQDKVCMKAGYQRLLDLDPDNFTYRANLAFALTDLGEHHDAEKIYQDLLSSGNGTYDLMAYYGRTLKALGKIEDAIYWYENSLAIHPRLIEVTRELALCLVKAKRELEALSLLNSFVMKYPDARAALGGNILTITESMKKVAVAKAEVPVQPVRLMAIGDSHHYLPVALGNSPDPVMFMVDTGASLVTMNTSDLKKSYPDIEKTAESTQASLADGTIIDMKMAVIPTLKVGPWTVRNVEVAFCEGCQNLAGRALLRRFTIRTLPKGEFETMELVKAGQF